MFLGDLIQRTLGEATGIAPRRASRFEPDNDALGAATVEAPASAPAPARDTISPTPLPRPSPAPPRDVETEFVEREAPFVVPQQPPEYPAAAAAERTAEMPPPRIAPAPPLPPERLAARREPSVSLPSVRSGHTPVQPPPVERHSETIVREISETRVESRTIERRLESLVRETERTEESHTTLLVPAKPDAAVAPPPSPEARTVIVPSAARSVPSKPVPVELPAAAPAAPVVHVTIGRVEVRAAAPAPAPREPRPREPRLNLEDYLRRRERA